MSASDKVMRWSNIVKTVLSRGNFPAVTRELVLAIIWQESSGNPYAWNPEPRYPYLWNVNTDAPFRKMSAGEVVSKSPPNDFPSRAGDRDQEWWAQQASWGLMQIMGAAARERGFAGDYLTELVDPATNIEFGVRHLWGYAFENSVRVTNSEALLRWNGGGDPSYPQKVLAKLGEIKG